MRKKVFEVTFIADREVSNASVWAALYMRFGGLLIDVTPAAAEQANEAAESIHGGDELQPCGGYYCDEKVGHVDCKNSPRS